MLYFVAQAVLQRVRGYLCIESVRNMGLKYKCVPPLYLLGILLRTAWVVGHTAGLPLQGSLEGVQELLPLRPLTVSDNHLQAVAEGQRQAVGDQPQSPAGTQQWQGQAVEGQSPRLRQVDRAGSGRQAVAGGCAENVVVTCHP